MGPLNGFHVPNALSPDAHGVKSIVQRRRVYALFSPTMSFADIEATAGSAPVRRGSSSSSASLPRSKEDALFLDLQSSLSLQVFKMNANVQGILKYVDQLGTAKDNASLRKTLYVPLEAVLRKDGAHGSVRVLPQYTDTT